MHFLPPALFAVSATLAIVTDEPGPLWIAMAIAFAALIEVGVAMVERIVR